MPQGNQGGVRWGFSAGSDWTFTPTLINELRVGHQSASTDFNRPGRLAGADRYLQPVHRSLQLRICPGPQLPGQRSHRLPDQGEWQAHPQVRGQHASDRAVGLQSGRNIGRHLPQRHHGNHPRQQRAGRNRPPGHEHFIGQPHHVREPLQRRAGPHEPGGAVLLQRPQHIPGRRYSAVSAISTSKSWDSSPRTIGRSAAT